MSNPRVQVRVSDRMPKCGFCTFPATGEPHAHCPIATLNGDGVTVLRCACTCSAYLIKCFTCGLREQEADDGTGEVNPETWRCFDEDACAARIEARLAANPVIQQIRAIQAASETRVRAERIATTSRPTSGKCLHCGEPTKGGMFLPGHDAAFLSLATATIVAGDATLSEVLDSWAELGISEALRGKLQKRAVAA